LRRRGKLRDRSDTVQGLGFDLLVSESIDNVNLLQAPGRKTRSRLMKEHDKDAIKNWEVKMVETTLQQCLSRCAMQKTLLS
jgi:hypothetical protein